MKDNSQIKDIIILAAKLQFSKERVVAVVVGKYPNVDSRYLLKQLNTPDSDEYKAYHNGIISENFDIESGLFRSAATGDADAQKSLSNLQNDRIVSEAVRAKFFPKEDADGE